MGESRRIIATLMTLVIAFAVHITSVHAQGRTAEAEAMFDQGKHLMAAGKFEEACLKFEGSEQLEPRATTLMNLGACREAQKKVVSAWAAYVAAAKLAELAKEPREQALQKGAQTKAQELEPLRSTLEIVVSAEARVPGLVVSRNGEIVVEGQWNSEIPTDGGEYTIVARGRDTEASTEKIVVASVRDHRSIEIPVLKPAAVEVPPPPVATSTDQTDVEQPNESPAPTGTWTPMRKAAVGVAAVGVVAIAGGAVFGAKGSSKQSAADALCPGTECTDPDAVELNRDARSAATRANILFVGGGLAVAGGVALWFLGAPTTDGDVAIRAHVGTDLVGISFSGGF